MPVNIQWADQTSGSNGDGTPDPQFQFDFTESLRQASVEARLSDRSGAKVDRVVGLFHIDDKIAFASLWTSFAVRPISIFPYRQTRRSSAAFGQLDAEVASWLRLMGGLRDTRDHASFDGANIDLNPWGISTFTGRFGTTSPFAWSGRFADDDVSGRVSSQLKPTETLRLFASAGTGYRGRGFDGTSMFTIEETLPFTSGHVRALEAGVRDTNSWLRLTRDAFDDRFRDLKATTRLSNDTNGRANVGRALSRGVEGSVAARLFRGETESLDVNVGATFPDTEILSFIFNHVADVTSTVGDRLPGAPRWTLNAAVDATMDHGRGWRGRTRFTLAYRGEESKRRNAQPNTISPGQTLLNLRHDLTTPAGFDVDAHGRNLTNGISFPERNGAVRLVGAPRTSGVGAVVSF